MAKISSRPNNVSSTKDEIHGIRFGSGRWRNKNTISGVRYKVCLCGRVDVGKTSLFLRLQGQGFFEEKPICQTSTFEFCDDEDQSVEYSVWDTNGFEKRNSLSLGDHYRGAHCILLVYDATDFDSLEYLDHELAAIEKYQYAPDAKFILVQNKIDMKLSRCISYSKQNDFISNSRLRTKVDYFCRTSAKLNEGVTELFKTNLKQVLAMPIEESDEIQLPGFKETEGQKKKKKKKKKGVKCKTM